MKNDMKTIAFMVGTEYHVLMTIGIINQFFKHGYNIWIFRVSNIDEKRIKDISFSSKNINYRDIVYSYKRPDPTLKGKIDEIIKINPNEFFFFLENKFWLNYLLKKLHGNGTKVVLGPDGMKAYSNYCTSNISRLKQFLYGFYGLIQTHIYYSFPFVEKRYATSKYIDEVWVECMSAYKNNTRKRVFEFQISYDEEYVNDLNNIFHVSEKAFASMKGKTILFLDSPYSSKMYYERTIEILSGFKELFPDRKLLMKLHQLSSEVATKEFCRLSDITYLNSKYPAELFIANADDCVIVSLISSSLLFFNPNCKYFWTYPMYKDMVDYSDIVNPTNHIKVISNITEI